MLSRAAPLGILRCIQSTRVLGRMALEPLRCQQQQFFTNVAPDAEPVMLYQAYSPHNHVRVVEVGRRSKAPQAWSAACMGRSVSSVLSLMAPTLISCSMA